jgi:serine/threonine protein kinase
MDVIKQLEQQQVKVYKNVKETGHQLGVGSFGTVVELDIKGIGKFAGKKIHEVLISDGGLDCLIKECKLMSSLCHPDITKFKGVCMLPSTKIPALVMELMDFSLEDVVENKRERFDLHLTTMLSIFIDIASGLAYLHSRTPCVLHRDLTARNVLLDKCMNAKITDFGNSRIIDTTMAIKTMTQAPGTTVYMPPEALDSHSKYGDRLDIFSFGHLALYTLIREFPKDLLPATYYYEGHLVARNEVERRSEYMRKLNAALPEEDHSLYRLTKQCLHNDPTKRPQSTYLLHWLQEIVRLEQEDFETEGTYPVEEERLRAALQQMEQNLYECQADPFLNPPADVKTGLIEKKPKGKTKGWKAHSFTIDYKRGTFQYTKQGVSL